MGGNETHTIVTAPEVVHADIGRYAAQHGVDVAIHVKATNTDLFCNPPFSQRM